MIKVWKEGLSPEEERDIAYYERNMLALLLCLNTEGGWYNDDVQGPGICRGMVPRFDGWRRVISIADGEMTFHIPDDFDIGPLVPKIPRNWDGHTTMEKWERVSEMLHIRRTP